MYSKESQLNSSKKKDKSSFGMRKNKGSFGKKKSYMKPKPKAKKEELPFLDWLHLQVYPCFHCGTYHNIEWHHVKEYSSDRKDHTRLIPLCSLHHKYCPVISAHGNAKVWRKRYSLKVQLDFAIDIYEEFMEIKK